MNTHLILTIIGAVVVGLIAGAILWQVFIAAPEISMADADHRAACEERDRALERIHELDAIREDLDRERAVNRHLHHELHERSLTPRFLFERIGEPAPLDEDDLEWQGSKPGDTGWWRLPLVPDDVRNAVELHIGAHRLTDVAA